MSWVARTNVIPSGGSGLRQKSMNRLKSKVQGDHALSKPIDRIAHCVVASLFYFELSSIPQRFDEKNIGSGHILCTIRGNNPALKLLLSQLAKRSARFYLNGHSIPGMLNDLTCLGADGNFRKRVELKVTDKFTITLKQGDLPPCDISASPFSVNRLIQAQGLDASFGRADHGKRKLPYEYNLPPGKRQRG